MATHAHIHTQTQAHHRHQSNHSKRPLPAHARPSRPAALSKRTNSHSAAATKGLHKVSRSHSPPEDEDVEDDEVMATSFLQYCTTCEKQIIVPNNSVLYCSESCRKKDDNKQLPYMFEYSPPPTPIYNLSHEDFVFHDIVPARSPTKIHSKRSSCAFSETSTSSDDHTSPAEEPSHRVSEASRYLRQFQSATYSAESSMRPVRPRYSRASTTQPPYTSAFTTFSTAPSLSHTPASSVSYSLPYTPSSTRPLPPRTNPHSRSFGSKSIDLVIPSGTMSPPGGSTSAYAQQYSLKSAPVTTKTSVGPVEGEITYEKSPVPELSPANGSLRQLFAGSGGW